MWSLMLDINWLIIWEVQIGCDQMPRERDGLRVAGNGLLLACMAAGVRTLHATHTAAAMDRLGHANSFRLLWRQVPKRYIPAVILRALVWPVCERMLWTSYLLKTKTLRKVCGNGKMHGTYEKVKHFVSLFCSINFLFGSSLVSPFVSEFLLAVQGNMCTPSMCFSVVSM